MTTVGILALQGDFAEHAATLAGIGVAVREVRLPQHLDRLDALIVPGGESTTMARLLAAYDLLEPLRTLGSSGFPIWGTCAGAIILAKRAPGLDRPNLGLMDIGVERNAFGRQIDSFETDLQIRALGPPPFHAVFIRAPIISDAGTDVEILARLEDGRIVAARSGNLLATAFHPELSGDDRFHRLFAGIAQASLSANRAVRAGS
ncbi:MAG TPA: pyridoxal 5'-phosphate synthase glutaminase subunit PdxT [Dehalococcoidia bacterium]|nr:pyridoxal 5'-phosphate synthase glutaminase subunit PdxT [Dehalococcoidia bacterium]